MTRASVLMLATALTALLLNACSDDDPATPEPQVASVAVAPASPTLQVGDTLRITASPRAPDGRVVDNVSVGWQAEREDVVGLSGSGYGVLLRARAPGTSRITATASGRTGEITVTVQARPAPVAAVEVSPASAQLSAGDQLELTAVLKDASGGLLGNRAVTWSISGTAGALQPHPHPLKTVLSTHAAGTVTVRAASEGVQGEAQIQVSMAQPQPAGIVFEPPTRTLLAGDSLALHAELRSSNGQVVMGYPITWSSSNTGILRVEPQATNGEARLRGVAAGTAVVSAAGAGFQGGIAFTVTAPPPPPTPVAFVAVQPSRLGLWEYQQRKLTALTLASNGLELPDRHVAWSAANLGLVQVDAAGVVRAGGAPGVTRVYAESEGRRGEAEVHVYRITSQLVFHLTYDWWDGQVRVVEAIARTQWTNPQGQVQEIELFPERGTFTIDRDHGRYERVIHAVGYGLVNGQYQQVVERDITDSGTTIYRWQPYTNGASTFDFYSGTTAGLRFAGNLRAPGELLVALPMAGGELRDVLFRLQ